jgi:integrase
MTPRPRKRGNKDLAGLNLYVQKRGERNYYQYKHPITGKYHGFGFDRKEAIEAAKQLQQLLKQNPGLVGKVVKPEGSFSEYLEYFRDEIIPQKRVNGQPLSDSTIREYNRLIKTFIAELGHHGFETIRQSHIAEYLNTRSTAEVYNKHRTLLVMIFRQAVSDEKYPDNIAEKIVKRDMDKTKRQPLSLEQYELIYKHASTPIKNAMELSLNALQRRIDIQWWRFDSKVDEHYRVIIQKTRKHGKNSNIEIPASLPVVYSAAGAKTLDDIVRNCRDDLACPYLVHQMPKRWKESKEKDHFMQLSGKQISDGFAEAREAAGIIMENPPTFHELLALGEWLRENQGWETKDIQKLRGHRKEKTTQDYLDRHIEWVRIEMPTGLMGVSNE